MEYKKFLGGSVSVLGMGTWGVGGLSGRHSSNDSVEIKALELGLELGMNWIDTAELYGAGHSEEIVAKAIKGKREKVFIATKVLPHHFSYRDVLDAAERSLRRLQTDYIDLYQLH